jgi:hypothetical protein
VARGGARSRGGSGYTPKSGPFAGTTFGSYHEYRNARAVRGGYESEYERQQHRKMLRSEFVGTEVKAKLRADPRGEKAVMEWRLAGKRGDRELQDEIWLDAQFDYPELDKEDFWYH